MLFLFRNTFRSGNALEIEIEILKSIKALINTRVSQDFLAQCKKFTNVFLKQFGVTSILAKPEYIHTIVFSVLCPHWQTRKLVCELLVFLCYAHPKGHEHVLRGFELLQQHRRDFGIFDAWLKGIEHAIDGRGRMGSLVGASEEFKSFGLYNSADSHLMEYAVRPLYQHFWRSP